MRGRLTATSTEQSQLFKNKLALHHFDLGGFPYLIPSKATLDQIKSYALDHFAGKTGEESQARVAILSSSSAPLPEHTAILKDGYWQHKVVRWLRFIKHVFLIWQGTCGELNYFHQYIKYS